MTKPRNPRQHCKAGEGHKGSSPITYPAESPASKGFRENEAGTLGTVCLLGVEIPNTKPMIKSITIKDCGGDIARRWHVEYREFDPLTKKWLRRREFGGVNRQKDPDKRMRLLEYLRTEIISADQTKRVHTGNTVIHYLAAYCAEKEKQLRKTSAARIAASVKHFTAWLQANNHAGDPLMVLRKEQIKAFRESLVKKVANRTVNNILADVSTFFQYHIDNYEDLIYKNPCAGIQPLPVISETHVAYTDDQQNRYWAWMAEHNPHLLLYCQFVGLGFLRCNEARHVRVGDIDFKRRTITLWAANAKTRQRVVKPMLNVFFDLIMTHNIHRHPTDHFVFSHNGQPGEKLTGIHYFRKRFRKLKDQFGLDRRYSIYGFRHTSVSNMIDNNAPWREIMKYTGHTSMTSFEQYARSLANKPARDLSSYLNLTGGGT